MTKKAGKRESGKVGKREGTGAAGAPDRAKRGRRPVITVAVVRQVGEWIGKGMTEEQACAYCGINPESFGPACARNSKLKAELNRAQLTFMAMALDRMAAGCAEGWTSMAWILERRHKRQFCRIEARGLADDKGELIGMSPEDVSWLRRKVLERAMAEEEAQGGGQ